MQHLPSWRFKNHVLLATGPNGLIVALVGGWIKFRRLAIDAAPIASDA